LVAGLEFESSKEPRLDIYSVFSERKPVFKTGIGLERCVVWFCFLGNHWEFYWGDPVFIDTAPFLFSDNS
jgi:hypothetical protein